MTVLSDVTLREHIANGELIVDGDVSAAVHCAYEFKAGKVTFGGQQNGRVNTIDLAGSTDCSASIEPTAVAWVRSRVEVKIPRDMVGIWIQTNSLSRRGMLLLNSTLVEPGYEGFLSAHLVNLGAQVVTLSPDTTIAKLLFMRLDKAAEQTIDSSKFDQYDSFIERLAAASHPSFLRINELTHDLREHLSTVLDQTEQQARDALTQLSREAREGVERDVADKKQKLQAELETIEKRTLLRVGSGFGAGLLLAMVLLGFVLPRYKAFDAESEARIKKIVEAANAQRDRELEQLGEKIDYELQRTGEDTDQAPADSDSAPAP